MFRDRAPQEGIPVVRYGSVRNLGNAQALPRQVRTIPPSDALSLNTEVRALRGDSGLYEFSR